jgi:hypothetical protein
MSTVRKELPITTQALGGAADVWRGFGHAKQFLKEGKDSDPNRINEKKRLVKSLPHNPLTPYDGRRKQWYSLIDEIVPKAA